MKNKAIKLNDGTILELTHGQAYIFSILIEKQRVLLKNKTRNEIIEYLDDNLSFFVCLTK